MATVARVGYRLLPTGREFQPIGGVPLASPDVTEVLIATDADAVFDEVDAALADESTRVVRVRSGSAVADVVSASSPDLVVLDLQIGNMGGIAT